MRKFGNPPAAGRVMKKPAARGSHRKQKRGNSADSRKIDSLIKAVETDYVKAANRLQGLIARAADTSRKMVYLAATSAYRLAELLDEDDERWSSFVSNPFWTGRKLRRDDCLRHAFVFMHGSRERQVADTAREQARALRQSWDDRATPAQVFEDLQTKGGFSALLEAGQQAVDRPQGQPDVVEQLRKASLLIDEDRLGDFDEFADGDRIYLKVEVNSRKSGLPAFRLLATQSRWR